MKIIILFAKAGGGHESCAKAIKSQIELANSSANFSQNTQNLEAKPPKIEVELVDILGKSPQWQQELFCQSYVFLTEKLPFLWSFLQILWKWDFLAKLTSLPLKIQILPYLKEILTQKPDKIICTYFLVNEWLEEIQRQSNQNKSNHSKKLPKIPIWTVVTDIFSPHTVWFVAKNCQYLVFSPTARKSALDRGIKSCNLVELSPFFNPKFNQKPSQNEIGNGKLDFFGERGDENNPKTQVLESDKVTENAKESVLKFDNLEKKPEIYGKLPTVLVVGGGESMPKGEEILQNLLKLELNFNLIFVCGRNVKLMENCQEIVKKWEKNNLSRNDSQSKLEIGNHGKVEIFGFTQKLYEFINIADLVVCKAGPATILECVSQQKPVIISHFIWEKEIGNRNFILQNGLGFYEPKPKKLAEKVQKLLTSSQELDIIQNNYQKINLENGLTDLTGFITQPEL